MKQFSVFLVFIYCNFGYGDFGNSFPSFTSRSNPDVQLKAALQVINRLLGPKANLFDLNLNEMEKDGFYILKNEEDKQVHVSAPNGVSLVWGVHHYLKNFCNCHISWDGDQLDIPGVLPIVNVTVESVDKLRYYQNVCTSSYSFVWWDWKRWEREIDWMALNGINLALAFTAQEAIWQRVYDALGLKFNEFTGPAFLAWNRMGNLRNFSFGLTTNWHVQQLALQHQILKRMRELGITPVLPAFCGMVPQSFKTAFPLASLTKMTKWSRFSKDNCCPYLLNPKDALFPVVSRLFLREYINEFNTNHVYNCDTFNENTPKSGDYDYLSNISKSIYNEINYIDPGAIWMVQGWMFIDPFWIDVNRVKAFVEGVPIGKMLILDLQSDLTPQYDRLHSYFGQPFVWCMLHNFGGQLGMYGHLRRMNTEVLRGRTFFNSTMVGIGVTPEGIDQNYIMYDFALDSALRSRPVNLSKWVSQYAMRRYGVFNDDLNEAWSILKDTAYDFRPETLLRETAFGARTTTLLKGEHMSKNILTKLPSLRMNELSWYNRSQMYHVFLKFLSAASDERLFSSSLFRHDFVDVTRQTVQFAVSVLYFRLVNYYALNDLVSFKRTSNTLLSILDELDVVLGSSGKFLLGKWLEAAKKCAKNENETIHYEFNARNQITLWGPKGEIRDYAAKQWSGLVADYYKPRWKVFVEELVECLAAESPCNSTAIKDKIFLDVEMPFGWATKTYPTEPEGNSIEVIRKFFGEWKDSLREIFTNNTFTNYEVRSL